MHMYSRNTYLIKRLKCWHVSNVVHTYPTFTPTLALINEFVRKIWSYFSLKQQLSTHSTYMTHIKKNNRDETDKNTICTLYKHETDTQMHSIHNCNSLPAVTVDPQGVLILWPHCLVCISLALQTYKHPHKHIASTFMYIYLQAFFFPALLYLQVK